MEDSLSLFYTYLSQLCFDKGQELIDKEKEMTQYGPYKLFLGFLPNLINAERFYINLGFVTTKNKIFMRKDNSVRSIYEGLRADFYRLEESCADEELASIALQSGRYITARIQLIDIYEKMYAMGISSKPVKYEDLLALVEAVMNHSFGLTHIAVTALKTAVSLECEILMLLLQAQIDLENWRFLTTLLNLHGANTRISAWEKSLQNRESWKLGFGASFLKVNTFPPLVNWLIRLKVFTLNKFTLYFQHTLQLQTTPLDFRALCNKHSIDYFQRLQNLQRRYDAMTVMLIFCSDGSSDCGPSYQLPNKVETKTLDSYTIMVYSPINLIEQLPTISKAITEKSSDLATFERVICRYSIKDQSTYFMTGIDPRVTLVFVFDSKKDEKETSLCKHILELSVQLRSNSTFSKLKLNS